RGRVNNNREPTDKTGYRNAKLPTKPGGQVEWGASRHCSRSAAVSRRGGTSRSSFARLACWNTPDAAGLFNVLRLVLCTQPRSSLVAFGGRTPNAPTRPR